MRCFNVNNNHIMAFRNICLVFLGCIYVATACTHSPFCECSKHKDTMVFCHFPNSTTFRTVIPTLPANVKELHLAGSLGALTAGMFSNVSFSNGLTAMMFWWQCTIDSVEAGSFEGLTNLQTLTFVSTSMTFIPAGLLDGVSNLQELHFIDHKYLTRVESAVFSAGTCVESIKFNNNSIETLDDATFKNASNCLVTLNLEHNKIKEVSNVTFTNLFKLDTLALSSNKNLSIFPAGFNELSSLKSLSLDSVFVSDTLPRGLFFGLNKLRVLSIKNGGLRVLKPADFKPITQLERLDLSINRLETLPVAPSVLTSLKEIRLTRNLPKAGAGLVINPGAFSAFPKLTIIDMSGTNIAQLVSGVFKGLTDLTSLDLKQCGLKVIIQGVFSGLQSLTVLSLDMNELSVLSSEIFSDLTSLKMLSLANNKIGLIEDNAFAGLGNLNSLWLEYNALTTLAAACLKPVTAAEVFLKNNPWDCTCDLDSLRTWIKENPKFTQDVSCETPVRLKDRSLTNLTHEEICNIPAKHSNLVFIVGISISFTVVAAAFIAAGLIYYYKCIYQNKEMTKNTSVRASNEFTALPSAQDADQESNDASSLTSLSEPRMS